MIAEVFPLGRTEIHWDTLLGVAKKALNRVVSRGIDSAGLSANNIPAYLITLGEIKGNTNIVNPGQTLQHIHYSFLVITPPKAVYELIQQSNIKAHITETTNSLLTLSVLSGTLEDWRSAIINCCTAKADPDLRCLLDKCLESFEREGLGRCWGDYKKVSINDGTYQLIKRT